MKQSTALLLALTALCVPSLSTATKLSLKASHRGDDDDTSSDSESTVALAEETSTSACLSHICGTGYHPKDDAQKINGSASDTNCCNPTCGLFSCTNGFKTQPLYASNVGATNEECCDKTCSIFAGCEEGTGVPSSKTNTAGISKAECCEPKCTRHSCVGDWTQDTSKKDVVAASNEECCTKSCSSVQCDRSIGLIPNLDRSDKAGNTTDYCCQKVCKYYSASCPANTGIMDSKKMKVTEASTTLAAVAECCDAKCSGHSCDDGYALVKVRLNQYVSTVFNGCCEKTCAAHTCSANLVKVTANENHTQPSDEACCEKTCALYICPHGWFNTTNATMLASTTLSNATCCAPSCEGYTCSAGMTLRPTAASVPHPGDASHECCESTVCKDLRDNFGQLSAAQNCNDFSGVGNTECTGKYKMFNTSGAITVVPCIMNDISICSMDDTRVSSGCSDM